MKQGFMSPDRQQRQGIAKARSVRELARRYVLALSLIAILTIISQAIVQFLIADQEYDSRVVNIAGRQRMLSQKITKTSYYIWTAQAADATLRYRKELGEAVSLWERSQVGLLKGDHNIGLPGKNSLAVIALFRSIEPHHAAIVAAARDILSSTESADALYRSILSIKEHEAPFLKGMNDIVFRYDEEAKAKVDLAKWIEIALLCITLSVLVLEAVYIFAPATRRIRADVRELARRDKELEQRSAELAQLNDELHRLARSDVMTQLPNRLAANEHLRTEFVRMTRSKTPYTVLMLDIDFFKRVNDTYGHAVGDQVLKLVSQTLKSTLRESDFCARFGGEEFLALLPATEAAAAYQVAEKLRRAIESSPDPIAGRITVSIGLALADPEQADEDVAVREADNNLYEAKRSGRNTVVFPQVDALACLSTA
jgi:diguanylate cyclase (GGDEF)-like protein